MTSRLLAAAGALTLRGPRRAAAWALHDFLWLYPTLTRNCTWHGPVVRQFQTGRKEVWLTIDDGPDPRDTPEILEVLRRHQAKATFFVVGKNVEAQRALCRRIIAEGHELGNHTYSHPAALWWAYPRPCVRQEMRLGSETIFTATGIRPRFFRSPVGMNNPSVHPEAKRLGLRVIGWSAEGRDGCPAAPHQIVARLLKDLRPGAILLLHESGPSRRRALTLHRLLEALTEAGYQCVLPPETDFR